MVLSRLVLTWRASDGHGDHPQTSLPGRPHLKIVHGSSKASTVPWAASVGEGAPVQTVATHEGESGPAGETNRRSEGSERNRCFSYSLGAASGRSIDRADGARPLSWAACPVEQQPSSPELVP